jgi:hypothetical protein
LVVSLTWGDVQNATTYDVDFNGTDIRPGVTAPQDFTGTAPGEVVNWTVTANAAGYTSSSATGQSTTA